MKSKTINLALVIISLILVFVGYFVALQDFPSQFSWISNKFIVLFAAPAFYFFLKEFTWRKLITLICLFIFAVLFEAQAIVTGFPYSEFNYTDKIAGKLFGIVPVSVGFAWTPLLLGVAYLVTSLKLKPLNFVILTALGLVLVDLVLDPGATAAQLWIWQTNNGYYGVPTQNFFGWFVSGFIGAAVYYFGLRNQKQNFNPLILLSLLFTLTFWTGVAIFHSLNIVVVLGILFIVYLYYQIYSKLPHNQPKKKKSN